MQQRICVLGSTGSIGESTLDVIQRHRDKYYVESLAANSNVEKIFQQCQQFKPEKVVLHSLPHAEQLKQKLIAADLTIEVLSGAEALVTVATSNTVDVVMAAIVGANGLLPTYEAVKAGKKILLANKEALVTSGAIFIAAMKASNAQIIPIDSEHNAIFQCLPESQQQQTGVCELHHHGVQKLLLTGSGGPFRTRDIDTLVDVTPEEACAHPNWDMGKKISVDSATMMNKGLEFIEAKWLFNVAASDIQVVLHPQSIIHSMVQYTDGSVLAQLGNPDMRTPIAHALAYPERIDAGVEPLDFFQVASFEFEQPDFARYPNLALAIDACKKGQAACTALNAANEIAVDAFLNRLIKFTDIVKINETSVNKFVSQQVENIDDVITLDQAVRVFAKQLVAQVSNNESNNSNVSDGSN